MKNPVQFVNEVRAEGAKVVWPTRREAGLTTAMVFVMATIVAIFFFFVDQILSVLVDILLSL
ncbi:MAG: preprotein translocase subunit SecE [Pseudomonadota bacterium]